MFLVQGVIALLTIMTLPFGKGRILWKTGGRGPYPGCQIFRPGQESSHPAGMAGVHGLLRDRIYLRDMGKHFSGRRQKYASRPRRPGGYFVLCGNGGGQVLLGNSGLSGVQLEADSDWIGPDSGFRGMASPALARLSVQRGPFMHWFGHWADFSQPHSSDPAPILERRIPSRSWGIPNGSFLLSALC